MTYVIEQLGWRRPQYYKGKRSSGYNWSNTILNAKQFDSITDAESIAVELEIQRNRVCRIHTIRTIT